MTLPKLPFPSREIRLKSLMETLALYCYSGCVNCMDSVFSLLSHWNWLYSDIKSLSLWNIYLLSGAFFYGWLLHVTRILSLAVAGTTHTTIIYNKNINNYPIYQTYRFPQFLLCYQYILPELLKSQTYCMVVNIKMYSIS